MKRDISCPSCADRWRKQVGKYPDETVKVVSGTALKRYRCDSCGKFIEPGEACAAVSVVTARQVYVAWETEFIAVDPPRKFISTYGPLPKQ